MRAREILPDSLYEVNMSPSKLKTNASKSGATIGIEFEMLVPGEFEDGPDPEEEVNDIADIVEFFNDFMDPDERHTVSNALFGDFAVWQDEQFDSYWEETDRELIKEYVVHIMDDDQKIEYLESAGLEVPDRQDELNLEVIDHAIENQSGLYEDIRVGVFRNVKSEENFSEKRWLNDSLSINNMYEASEYLNIPFPRGFDGAGFDVAEDLEPVVSATVNWNNEYAGGSRDPYEWDLEPDTSISEMEGFKGLELISPPLPIEEGLEQMRNVIEWAKSYGCKTNKSTGLHMNVSVPGYSITSLDYVKLVLLSGDQHVLTQFGREFNTYCKSMTTELHDKVQTYPKDAAAVLQQIKKTSNSIASKLLDQGPSSKYVSVSPKSKYVEFRSPGGDWLSRNTEMLEATMNRFVVALEAACNPELYRKDYLKALYKALSATSTDSTGPVLGKYLAGELDKNQAVQLIKQKYNRNTDTEPKRTYTGTGVKFLERPVPGGWEVFTGSGRNKQIVYLDYTKDVDDADAAVTAAMKRFPHVFTIDNISDTYVKETPMTNEVNESWKSAANAALAAGAMYLGSYGFDKGAAEPKDPEMIEVPYNSGSKVSSSVMNKMKRALESKNGKILTSVAKKAGLSGKELNQFLAQCAHESQYFTHMKEKGGNDYFTKNYDIKYNPKTAKILGNTDPGDGAKYHGRGFIQLTGRDNYTRAGKALGLPLDKKPELVEKPEIAAKVAVWFWKRQVRNKIDDFGDTKKVTRPINRGLAGLKNREDNFHAANYVKPHKDSKPTAVDDLRLYEMLSGLAKKS